ncbi:trophoblast glycoprotein-like [Astyanax mexicanus]|uniref:trophoblast glycoprotein-like n=1 Tax=Astyanax mexicanus TaxID=7994 RepID=UPI0020CAEBF6|nr:trophoblast glycoprotein-like [Astyanax mexicanus]
MLRLLLPLLPLPLPLLLPLLLCAGSGGAECVVGCECVEPPLTVRCVSGGLSAVPDPLPDLTRTLQIRGSTIQNIQHGTFTTAENLTTLQLTSNGITQLGSHSFSTLKMLSLLDLSENRLVLIHPEAFFIPGNPLKHLNLSGSLYNSTSATDLITALRWGALSNLQELDLSGNRLVLLPPGSFSPLLGLQRLSLAGNSLVAVYRGTFSGLERLQELDLSFNALESMSSEALRELETLSRARLLLAGNPYSCACGVQEFSRWLNGSNSRVGDVEKLRCSSPAGLRGVPVRALSSHALACRGDADVDVVDVTLQTSYVFLGLVLGFVGMMCLLVIYLNRSGIVKWVTELHAACRDVLEGYHYRYEIDSDPRLRNISTNSHPRRCMEPRPPHAPVDARITHIPSDVTL